MKPLMVENAISIYSLVIIALLITQAQTAGYFGNKKLKKLWLISLSALLVQQIFDLVIVLLDGKPGSGIRIVLLIFLSALYVLDVAFSSGLAMFIDYNHNYSRTAYRRLHRMFLVLFLAYGLLVLLNLPFGFLFSLTNSNLFRRGPLHTLSIAFTIAPLLISFFRIVFIHKDAGYRLRLIFSIGMAFPLIFVILQVTGAISISVIYPSITLAMLFYYLFLANNSLCIDDLTGLRNRRGIDLYFSSLSSESMRAVIFIDINNFKMINDEFGHQEGDDALKSIASILSSSVRISDLAARVGGDEFLLVTKIRQEDDISHMIDRINEKIKIFNSESSKAYSLSLSFGASITPAGKMIDKEKLIAQADERMYQHKHTIV